MPRGPGDPFWSGHTNRVYHRIVNNGNGRAEDFDVRVYVMQPIKMEVPAECRGPPSGKYSLIDSYRVKSLDPGEELFRHVDWVPMGDEPAKIKVEIVKAETEASSSAATAISALLNRVAYLTTQQEYVHSSIPGSVQQGSGFSFSISNLLCRDTVRYILSRVSRLQATQVPGPRWDVQIQLLPGQEMIPVPHLVHGLAVEQGETKTVRVVVTPLASARPGDMTEIPIVLLQDDHGHLLTIDEINIMARVANPTAINCNAQSSGPVGTPVSVSGAINPAHSDTRVALEYRSPSGRIGMQVVSTDTAGGFRDSFTPNEAGGWTVQVHWQGDLDHQPATASCSFSVGAAYLTLAVNPSSTTIPAGSYTIATVTIASVGAYDRTVSLSSSVPPGLSVIFVPGSGRPPFASYVRIDVAQAVPVGSYQIVIRGTDADGKSYSTVFAVIVTVTQPTQPQPQPPPRPTFDFSLSASPTSQALPQGQSASFTVTIGLAGGSTQPIALSLQGLPAGASYSFSPSAGSPPFTSTLTVTMGPNTLPGTYSLTIVGTGGGLTRSASVTVTVG